MDVDSWPDLIRTVALKSPGYSVLNLLLLCLCTIRVVPGQRSDIRVDVTLVRVPFVAVDSNGRRIRDIRREELALTDNGAPETIKYLWTEADRPLVVGLVIDVSSSEMGFVRANQEAVRRFIDRVIGPSDRGLLATVDEQPRLLEDLTFSKTEMENSLDLLARQRHAGELFGEICQPPSHSARRGARGCVGTAIWDGVFHLVRSKLAQPDGRKALLLLSDGLDLGASVHGRSSATEAAQSAGVAVYTIKYLSAPYLALSPITAAHALRDHGMEEVATQTGGLAFTNPKDLNHVYAEIEDDLRSQYILAYSLSEPAASGKWHRLEVRTARPGVRIRAQAGFTAP